MSYTKKDKQRWDEGKLLIKRWEKRVHQKNH